MRDGSVGRSNDGQNGRLEAQNEPDEAGDEMLQRMWRGVREGSGEQGRWQQVPARAPEERRQSCELLLAN